MGEGKVSSLDEQWEMVNAAADRLAGDVVVTRMVVQNAYRLAANQSVPAWLFVCELFGCGDNIAWLICGRLDIDAEFEGIRPIPPEHHEGGDAP